MPPAVSSTAGETTTFQKEVTMFGKNPITKPSVGSDGTHLNVVEVFRTLQGEGPFTGHPAIFVRLGGCNLRCSFCDTEFDQHRPWSVSDELIPTIQAAARNDVDLVVITGGEPLLQNLTVLIDMLLAKRLRVQIETAGVAPFQTECTDLLTVVCSPKTSFVHPTVQAVCRHWKYPVRHGGMEDGRPVMDVMGTEHISRLWFGDKGQQKPTGTVWLQPVTEHWPDGAVDTVSTRLNQQYAASACIAHGYNLSLQTHKIVNIP